jgi:hypothetical protein
MLKVRVARGVVGLVAFAVVAAPVAVAASPERKPPPARTGPTTTTVPSTTSAGVTVTISGGHETDPRDGGRPVVLIASALGVPAEVFRTAFSGVTPARGAEPAPAQVRANKAALLRVLAPYGITNARLDQVSNYYRYNGSAGQMWPTTAATAAATVVDGQVTGLSITNPGSGYSSPPTISVTGAGVVSAVATVAYTTAFATNGSVSGVTLR